MDIKELMLKFLADTVREVKREGRYFTFTGDYDVSKAKEAARRYGCSEVDIKNTVEAAWSGH